MSFIGQNRDTLAVQYFKTEDDAKASCDKYTASKECNLQFLESIAPNEYAQSLLIEKRYGYDRRADEEVDDYDYVNRKMAAMQGYGLDKLVKDEDSRVRCEVARQGYKLDELANDADKSVHDEVERQLKKKGLTLDEWIDLNSDILEIKDSEVNMDI